MVCPPRGGAVCGAQYPPFAAGASEVATGLWPFCILLNIIILAQQ